MSDDNPKPALPYYLDPVQMKPRIEAEMDVLRECREMALKNGWHDIVQKADLNLALYEKIWGDMLHPEQTNLQRNDTDTTCATILTEEPNAPTQE